MDAFCKRFTGRFILFSLATALGFGFFISYCNVRQFPDDWHHLFNLFSLLNRSIILHYGRFPLHDPWLFGGADLLANPQTRMLAPTLVLDLLLPPQWAILSTMMLYSLLGLFGTYKLLRHFKISAVSSVVGSILFIQGSWFALHFTAGHLTYALMQLLPFFFYLSLNIDKESSKFGCGALFTLFVLEGAVQTLVYALLLFVCARILVADFQKKSAKMVLLALFLPLLLPHKAQPILFAFLLGVSLMFASKKNIRSALAIVSSLVGFVLIVSPKLVPVLLTFYGREPMHENVVMKPKLLFWSLLSPFQKIVLPEVTEATSFSFQEYGCYLGWVALFLVGFSVYGSQSFRQENRRLIFLFLFWLWFGSAVLWPVNPFSLYAQIPFLSQAHVSSRAFILMYLFFCVLVAKALDGLHGKRTYAVMSLLCLLDISIARFSISSQLSGGAGRPLGNRDLITSRTIEKTVAEAAPVSHFFPGDLGAKAYMFDRSQFPTKVRSSDSRGYRGEAYLTEGEGKVRIDKFTPGEITFHYASREGGTVEFNTNELWGWSSRGRAKVQKLGFGNFLTVDVPKGEGTEIVFYSPVYLRPVLVLCLLGALLVLWRGFKILKINSPEHQ